MRFSSIVTSIRDALQQRQGPGEIVFRGRSTASVTSELFIDGQPGRRIVPSNDSTVLLELTGVANTSAGASLFTQSIHMFRCSAAGVITQVDIDGTTGGSQGVELAGAVLGASGAVVPKTSVMTATGINGYIWTIVPAAGITPAYLSLSVAGTGGAGTWVDWEFEVEYIEAGPRG
jgi:hypothetical protein